MRIVKRRAEATVPDLAEPDDPILPRDVTARSPLTMNDHRRRNAALSVRRASRDVASREHAQYT
jgi:hypothetical protein